MSTYVYLFYSRFNTFNWIYSFKRNLFIILVNVEGDAIIFLILCKHSKHGKIWKSLMMDPSIFYTVQWISTKIHAITMITSIESSLKSKKNICAAGSLACLLPYEKIWIGHDLSFHMLKILKGIRERHRDLSFNFEV